MKYKKSSQKNNDSEMEALDFVEETLLKEYLKDKNDFRPLMAELYLKNLSKRD